MIPLIVGWALTYVGLYTVMLQRKSTLASNTEELINCYRQDFYYSLFLSKASILANAMQQFVNDNQIQTNLVEDLSNEVLNQVPSNTPTERFGVYLNYWATYNNYQASDPMFVPIPFGEPQLYTDPHYGQVRTYQQNFTYDSMIPSHQQTLYWASAADVFVNAVSYNNREFYINMYQGYDSGMGYFSAGTWQYALFRPPIPAPTYPDCTPTTPNPKVFGYDPRCRPWYLHQADPEMQGYAQYANPYTDQTGAFTYVTVTDWGVLAGNSANFVAAIDLNLNQSFFSRTMTAYMTQDLKYFMSLSRFNSIILKSSDAKYTDVTTTDYFMIDQILPYSAENNQTTEYLRGNFSLMYPALDTASQVFIGTYQDWDNATGSMIEMDLISAPMFLVTQDPLHGGTNALNQTFYMGVGLSKTHLKVNPFSTREYILIGIQVAVLIACIVLSYFFINLILARTILPIEILRQRMVDITLIDDGEFHVSDDRQSEEIKKLYTSFSALLSNRRIMNNEFLKKPDALAVIEIAEACTLFDGKSYQAAAVCYNNIGNLQYKNQKFNLAADNFLSAVILAQICLGEKLGDNVVYPKDFYDKEFTQLVEVPQVKTEEQEQYFKKVLACRYYQFAMSLYKGLRYKGKDHFSSHQVKAHNSSIQDIEDARHQHVSALRDTIRRFSQLKSESSQWQEVDLQLRNAIDAFQKIDPYTNGKGRKIPIFLDLIIKVTICRAFTMNKNRSIITAQKLLGLAESMILVYEREDDFQHLISLRNGAPVIPKEILKQKLCLHKGNLMISFGKMSLAKDLFLESINKGNIYDIRVRMEAINNVLSICKAKQHDPQYQRLANLLNSYKHQERDFVFLVNNSSYPQRSMAPHMARVSDALNKLMENKTGQIEDSDRIALITFAKNSNRVFSLVEKNQNLQQLKNQFQQDKLLANQGVKSQLGKAVNNSISEFDRKSNRKRWLVVFTNQVQKEEQNRVSLQEASELLRRKQVNLVLIGFGLPPDEVRLAEQLAADIRQNQEMHLELDPSPERIDKLFTSLANYKIEHNQPLIIETFKST